MRQNNDLICKHLLINCFISELYTQNTYKIFMNLFLWCFIQDTNSPNRTLDLASALEVGPTGSRVHNDYSGNRGNIRSVMTIAFQFAFESHLQEDVASMARQYIRNIIASVQRLSLTLSPSHLGSHGGLRIPPGSPEAATLARWICHSYRFVIILSNKLPCIHLISITCGGKAVKKKKILPGSCINRSLSVRFNFMF